MIGSINRIRLEFKVYREVCANDRGLGINRIRLEFKEYTMCGFDVPYSVLIESDWNLKSSVPGGYSSSNSVLIESDWNLK